MGLIQPFRCAYGAHSFGPVQRREYYPHAIIEFLECGPCGNRKLVKCHARNRAEAQAAVDLMWEND